MLRPTIAAVVLAAAAACAGDGAPAGGSRLPAWLKVGAEIRGRAETNTSINFVDANDDGRYLHRLRLNLGIEPHPQVRFFIQVQDSHAPGYATTPAPGTVVNTVDLRLGYFEVGPSGGSGWSLRLGRQELPFGEQRLMGVGAWGNVGRSFDAARLAYERQGMRLDWFASAVVVPLNGSFDHPRLYNGFYGFYSSFDRLVKDSVVDSYFLWKTASRVRGELGSVGDLDVYTLGARVAGKLPRGLDYGLEMAGQAGHSAGDDLRAWAGHWALGYTLPLRNRPPRLVFEYNYASGDRDPADGRCGTFDQLYPTNHAKYGTADRIGWRNIHDLTSGLEWRLSNQWRSSLDFHRFWLASRSDALYTEGGAPLIRLPGASSSHVGDEIDVQVSYQFSSRLALGAGYARLFPGGYLKQAGRGAAASYPYFMWTCRL